MRFSGQEAKQMGLELVANHNPDFVQIMRTQARGISRLCGEVTTDDLHAWAESHDIYPKHPNAWGSVFTKAAGFERIGYRPSTRPAAHARVISVWKAV